MRGSAVLRALVLPLWLAAPSACSASHAALPTCSVEGGVCAAGLTCISLSTPGPDGLCHGVGGACSLPCETAADCAPMGANAVCSTECSTIVTADGGSMGVCTPYQ
jgi:hypothetical protein